MGAQASRLFREASEAYLLNDAVRLPRSRHGRPPRRPPTPVRRRYLRHADNIDSPTAIQLAVLARFYERIGDHAVTIGERVTYLVTGTLFDKHRG